MESIIKNRNETKYYLDNELLLSITKLEGDNYIVENKFSRIKGYVKNIDKYRTEYNVVEDFDKNKNKKLDKRTGLFKENALWFVYILEQKGFISKTVPIN